MTGYSRFTGLVLILCLSAACRQTAELPQKQEVPQTQKVPKMWSDLGVPSTGLQRVSPDSNEHGFYADYSGRDRSALLGEVSRGLTNAGYTQTCTALDGLVLGFSNGRRQLALKIDIVGVLSLSLFDAEGREPLLHGLCFGRYHEGPWHTLTQEEKEALAKDPGAGNAVQQAAPPDRR